MDRKHVIRELKSSNQLVARCPRCDSEFPIAQARMFDGTSELPEDAARIIERREREIEARTSQIKGGLEKLGRREKTATEGAEKKAMLVGLCLVLEKIVTCWKDFPHQPQDCRALYEPIDYIAFDGLTDSGKIDQIAFLDVKTGEATLKKRQRLLRDAVKAGQVDYKEV